MGSRAQPEEKHRGGLRRGEGKQRRRTEGKKGRQKRRKEEGRFGAWSWYKVALKTQNFIR